jgi:hypothetical protein
MEPVISRIFSLGKDTNSIENSIATITTIEYLLSCIECKHQTSYGYLWFAIQDGKDHVLTRGHKSVTISEIIWEEDKALENIHMDIKLVYDD